MARQKAVEAELEKREHSLNAASRPSVQNLYIKLYRLKILQDQDNRVEIMYRLANELDIEHLTQLIGKFFYTLSMKFRLRRYARPTYLDMEWPNPLWWGEEPPIVYAPVTWAQVKEVMEQHTLFDDDGKYFKCKCDKEFPDVHKLSKHQRARVKELFSGLFDTGS